MTYVFKANYANYDPNNEAGRIWPDAWRQSFGSIEQARRTAEANGAKFLLVSFADKVRLSEASAAAVQDQFPAMKAYRWDINKPERMLGEFAASRRIDYLALMPFFRDDAAYRGVPLHWPADGHWTEAGHRLAADMIYGRLLVDRFVADVGWPARSADAPKIGSRGW